MTRVKICGITNEADALLAAEAGADALGFIFVEGTPRYVTPERVRSIVRRLPPFVTTVGVFWDHAPAHVKAVAETCGLQVLQFHGDERPEDVEGYALPVIKTVKVAAADASGSAPGGAAVSVPARIADYVARGVAAILLDSAARWSEGEPRQPIAWDLARTCAPAARIVLSAGLTPDNVGRAIEVARPWAVDVNSGVEARPGIKDPDRVRRFIAAARGAA
jgi:phosphoribosylanthranilate isomerase